ncbi:endolytic transglycosylase MltG [Aliikangiella maris]|uniref:Endolytic transglycosylase MltG n=2 Tax=Aliikangiella maris TaxID=3162458 RepID=A0ABV3ML89_9GAMM
MSKRSFISLRLIFGLCVLGLVLFLSWHGYAYKAFINSPLNISQQQVIEVRTGDNINQLSRQWYSRGIISNSLYLKVLARLNPQLQKIKVGEYLVEVGDTPLTLLVRLSQGKVIQYSVTIVEGINAHQLIQQFKQQENLVFDLPEPIEKLHQILDLSYAGGQSNHIEGWFYPDTYYFSRASSVLAILKRANQKMQQVLEEEWQARQPGLPYNNPYEALIMASIIEKETGIAVERGKIAGVFVRRLQKNMRLQTDPTVIYGIGPDFNGDITYKDLKTRTSYNTYQIKGLPPTPIAMPGRAAIHAALHPEEGNELYFVATGDGGHYFSETLEQHNAAVRRYQLKR